MRGGEKLKIENNKKYHRKFQKVRALQNNDKRIANKKYFQRLRFSGTAAKKKKFNLIQNIAYLNFISLVCWQ